MLETLTGMHALIVGFGSIGKRHANNVRKLQPDAGVTVLLPPGSRSAALLPAGAALVNGVEEAIRREPDCALICSPSFSRLEYLLPLLSAGIPCYVEKPLVASKGDAAALRAYVKAREGMPATVVGCNLRLLPSLQQARELIASGGLGKVVRASLSAGQWLEDWRPGTDYRGSYSARPDRGGGVILDLIHEIDVARWLLGDLQLVAAAAGRLSRLEISAEDTACLLLRGTASMGPLVSINLDYVSRRRVRRYEVVGEEGTLIWDLDRQVLECLDAQGVHVLARGAAAFDTAQSYVLALESFFRSMQGAKPFCDLEDGLRAAELALEARDRALQ